MSQIGFCLQNQKAISQILFISSKKDIQEWLLRTEKWCPQLVMVRRQKLTHDISFFSKLIMENGDIFFT